ncbi:MAG: hypothetical protein ACTSRK_16655 [Promethearchaeota archaeon]
MFNIRVKQLKRRIVTYYKELRDLEAQLFAAKILPEVFGDNWENDDTNVPPIQEIMNSLEQINVVGQIFARAISHLATDDPTPEIFYKISCLYCVGQILTCELSENEENPNSCDFASVKLDESKYDKMQEDLRPIKKNRNNSLTTIESIVKYIVENSREHYKDLESFQSWKEILNFVFDVDVDDRAKGAKQLKQINIKELLLSEGSYGPLVQAIYQKYDGLLIYTMSMLTMLSSTSHSEKFTPYLNKILENLGTSTKIILLQGRLTKDFENIHDKIDQMAAFKVILQGKLDSLEISIDQKIIDSYFTKLVDIPEISYEGEIQNSYSEIEGYEILSKNARIKMSFNRLDPIWAGYRENFVDIRNSLINLDQYFDKMIRGVNDITTDLFSGGFQAALPLHDIDSCEKVGIHVKNLTATSSNQKTKISEEDFDLKQQLLRKFEDTWDSLREILQAKSVEEDAIRADPKIFTPLLNTISQTYSEWAKNKVLSAFTEEAIVVSRYLYSSLAILEDIFEKILPFEKKFLNNELMRELQEDLEFFTLKMHDVEIIKKVSLVVNDLTKNLWQLNRDFVLQMGEDQKYLQDPDQITELVAEIPKTLKKEFIQKLITREKRQEKMDYYSTVLEIIEKLKEIPLDERKIILPFDQVKKSRKTQS